MDVRIMVKRIILGWIVLATVVALFGRVTVAETNAGRTAADFLLIGAGARPAGMGGAFTAVSEGAVASYWNPAGLTGIEEKEVLLSHFAWYQDISLEYGVYAQRLSDVSTLSASITYLGYGEIEGYDAEGIRTDDVSAYDLAGAVSFAYRVDERLSLGLTGKYVMQKLDDINGSTFAVDFGARYNFDRFGFAAVFSNLGPKISFEEVSENLPATGRFGVSAYPLEDRLLTSLEIEKRFHGSTIIRHGFEYNFREQYFLRAGYNFVPSDDDRGLGDGMTFGAGVRLTRAEFDYAYTIEDKYTSEGLHRFTVIFKL